MSGPSCFIYSPELTAYRFNDEHPFTPLRFESAVGLLRMTHLLENREIIPPHPVNNAELLSVHSPLYVQTLQAASRGEAPPDAAVFGLGSEDNPIFPGMHQAASLVAGGTLAAADLVMSGRYSHALHLAGGLHHAQRAKAAGFCLYNDAAIAIAFLQRTYGARVAYVDIDAHHADGVQWMFYEDPTVLTISLHETGQYLFPGTGDVHERGRREGYGFSANIPLEPFTDDASFLEVFTHVVPPLVTAFRPDLIISQHGCDGHFLDDMSHLNLTSASYQEASALLHHLAHQNCQGRWIALGGGGYQPLAVTPRIWSLLWAEMSDKPVPHKLPGEWIRKWSSANLPHGVSREIPPAITDNKNGLPPNRRQAEISEKNLLNASQLLKEALPIVSRA